MVVDRLSKRIHAIPTVTSLDSARVAQLFLEHVWRHHGLPEEVISDHGPTFISNFSCNLAALLGVKLTPSTSYHPQTDSQMECVNQEIEAYLRVSVSHQQDDWADWLPLAEFSGTCGGVDAGGSVELCSRQSPVCNVSEYAEELRRCIRDTSEKHGVRYTGSYSDITPLLRGSSLS